MTPKASDSALNQLKNDHSLPEPFNSAIKKVNQSIAKGNNNKALSHLKTLVRILYCYHFAIAHSIGLLEGSPAVSKKPVFFGSNPTKSLKIASQLLQSLLESQTEKYIREFLRTFYLGQGNNPTPKGFLRLLGVASPPVPGIISFQEWLDDPGIKERVSDKKQLSSYISYLQDWISSLGAWMKQQKVSKLQKDKDGAFVLTITTDEKQLVTYIYIKEPKKSTTSDSSSPTQKPANNESSVQVCWDSVPTPEYMPELLKELLDKLNDNLAQKDIPQSLQSLKIFSTIFLQFFSGLCGGAWATADPEGSSLFNLDKPLGLVGKQQLLTLAIEAFHNKKLGIEHESIVLLLSTFVNEAKNPDSPNFYYAHTKALLSDEGLPLGSLANFCRSNSFADVSIARVLDTYLGLIRDWVQSADFVFQEFECFFRNNQTRPAKSIVAKVFEHKYVFQGDSFQIELEPSIWLLPDGLSLLSQPLETPLVVIIDKEQQPTTPTPTSQTSEPEPVKQLNKAKGPEAKTIQTQEEPESRPKEQNPAPATDLPTSKKPPESIEEEALNLEPKEPTPPLSIDCLIEDSSPISLDKNSEKVPSPQVDTPTAVADVAEQQSENPEEEPPGHVSLVPSLSPYFPAEILEKIFELENPNEELLRQGQVLVDISEFLIQLYAGFAGALGLDLLEKDQQKSWSWKADLLSRERVLTQSLEQLQQCNSIQGIEDLLAVFYSNSKPAVHAKLLGVDQGPGSPTLARWCRAKKKKSKFKAKEIERSRTIISNWLLKTVSYLHTLSQFTFHQEPNGEVGLSWHSPEAIDFTIEAPQYCLWLQGETKDSILYPSLTKSQEIEHLPQSNTENQKIQTEAAPKPSVSQDLPIENEAQEETQEKLLEESKSLPEPELSSSNPFTESQELSQELLSSLQQMDESIIANEDNQGEEFQEQVFTLFTSDRISDDEVKNVKTNFALAAPVELGAASMKASAEELELSQTVLSMTKSKAKKPLKKEVAHGPSARLEYSIVITGMLHSPASGEIAYSGTIQLGNSGGGTLEGIVESPHPGLFIDPMSFKGNNTRLRYFIEPGRLHEMQHDVLKIKTPERTTRIPVSSLIPDTPLGRLPDWQAALVLLTPGIMGIFYLALLYNLWVVPEINHLIEIAGGVSQADLNAGTMSKVATSIPSYLTIWGLMLFGVTALVPHITHWLYKLMSIEQQEKLAGPFLLGTISLALSMSITYYYSTLWDQPIALEPGFELLDIGTQLVPVLAITLLNVVYIAAASGRVFEKVVGTGGRSRLVPIGMFLINLILIIGLVMYY